MGAASSLPFRRPNRFLETAKMSSDSEHEKHDLDFERVDAGASHTYPQQAGTIRKGGFIVIKGRPCKVVDVSTSKTGKHGHAKCNFTAVDIFNGRKLEDMCPSSHNCDVPTITRAEYTLLDITEDGFISLMDGAGNTKDDLQLPSGTDELDKLAGDLKTAFADGKDVLVSVLTAMGEEQVQGMKLTSSG